MPDFSIERVEELRLGKAREAKIAALLAACYRDSFGGRSFFQNRHHCRFLAWQDDMLAGHLAVAYRSIRVGEREADLIGIGEVAVSAACRRQGIASQLVQNALDEGRHAGAHFAALFGEEMLYRRAGFVPASNPVTICQMEGARTAKITRDSNPHFMIFALSERDWDFKAPVDLAGFAF